MALVSKYNFMVLLPILITSFQLVAGGDVSILRRGKREWIIPPRKLLENHDYTTLAYIAKIRTDKEYTSRVTYSLTGHGANMDPIGLFTVNPESGLVRINGLLDREETARYNLLGVARYSNHSRAEADIPLVVDVLDVNDCLPVFQVHQISSVNESSAAGTVVMTVVATDADEAGTINSQIYYSIVSKTASDRMFSINYHTGEVMVQQNTLDRETKDTYTLTVKAADLNGAVGGNSATAEVVVKILDINDNVPTLEKESYEGSVEENTINVEVMRIKAIDLDLMYSVNWLAVFTFVSGNEAGYFRITTDAKTNEGVITVLKALDYEERKSVNLAVTVANAVKYNFGSGMGVGPTPKNFPIKINVVNQKEGPRFQPSTKVVTISEDSTTVSIHKVITNYAAIDSDTLKIATNVWYAKYKDTANWLIIDETTGDIKLNQLPDRESKYLINGTYYAEIICITKDSPAKTATGTIAIQVEDFNDNCPTLTSTSHTMCQGENVVYVTAIDEDEVPNSSPFDFRVISENKQKWTVEYLNGTTAILRDHARLWPGSYRVALDVRDQQGKSCAEVQVMNVVVCTCRGDTRACLSRNISTSTFGAAGVLLFLLGLLLLLLVPLLLLFCLCGGPAAIGDFKTIPFEAKDALISYHTEGQGEDKTVPLLHVPMEVEGGLVMGNVKLHGGGREFAIGREEATLSGAAAAAAAGGYHHSSENTFIYRHNDGGTATDYWLGGAAKGQGSLHARYGGGAYEGGAYEGMALSEGILGEYYSSKASHVAQQSQEQDALLVYGYEGRESPAGSVGCCSLLEDEDDLDFLDHLGPKFRTLAEICRGSALESADVSVSVSLSRPPCRPAVAPVADVARTARVAVGDGVDFGARHALNTSSVVSRASAAVHGSLVQERTATLPQLQVRDNVVIPNQGLFIQQPAVYYATTPVYMVDTKPQVVLVAGGHQQAVGQMGLGQGLMQVGGVHGSHQGIVLVERQVGVSGVAGHVANRTGQAAPRGSEQTTVVETIERATAGRGAPQAPGDGSGSPATLTGWRVVAAVENGGSGTAAGAGGGGGLARAAAATTSSAATSFSTSSGSRRGVAAAAAGSLRDSALTNTPTAGGSQRVVVQRQKISVTERNVASSSRA